MIKIERVFCMGLFIIQMSSMVLAQSGLEIDKLCARDICKIESNLSSYLGKEVEVRATYKVGFEMGWLESMTSCDVGTLRDRFHYVFDPLFETSTEKKILKKFKGKTKWEKTNGKMIRSVSGLFRVRVDPYKKTGPSDDRFDFQISIVELVSID